MNKNKKETGCGSSAYASYGPDRKQFLKRCKVGFGLHMARSEKLFI